MEEKSKRLKLSRETVRELTRDELSDAEGGRAVTTTLISIPPSACPCFSMGARVCSRDSC